MTEEEAKTKWCHRDPSHLGEDAMKCVGSACMAWRWGENEGRQFVPATDFGAGGGSYQGPPFVHGFCGLAGKS